jgi:hypothetical protein
LGTWFNEASKEGSMYALSQKASWKPS